MSAKVEREKVVPYSFQSEMPDVGTFKATLKFLRRTAKVTADIDATQCEILAGQKPATDAIEYRSRVLATLMVAVSMQGYTNPGNPSAWVEDILDPAIWYDIHLKWSEYQDSFYKHQEAKDAVEGGVPG